MTETLEPKLVQNQTITAVSTLWEMDKRFSAHGWLLKHLELFVTRNLVSPMRSLIWGRNSVRNYDDAEDRGYDKKRMLACNRLNRGSKFAST